MDKKNINPHRAAAKRNIAAAILALALSACGIMDDLSDTAHAQADRFSVTSSKTCRTIITINVDVGTTDTTLVCEAAK
jgi:hypothetical protein